MSELAPKAHMIHSIISNLWTAHAALAEFVDNAFAPAKGGSETIWIDIYRDRILVWDHGQGVDNINRVFQLGNTSSWEDPNDIGLYGVGATHAAIWLGSVLSVTTVRDGTVHQHEVDWDHCLKRDRWPGPYRDSGKRATRSNAPEQLLRDGKVTNGTLLEIKRRRRAGRGFHVDALLERLGFTFSPGLRAGKRISVRRGGDWMEAEAFAPPKLTEAIEFESEVGGMAYRCRAGLMLPTVLRYNGFFYGFTHRILEKTRDPFREGDSSMLHAQVDLSPGWRRCIAEHKNAVVRYREELADDLYEHCRELIERGQEYEEELHVEDLETKLQSMVNRMFRAGRGALGPFGPSGGGEGDSEQVIRPVEVQPRTTATEDETGVERRGQAAGVRIKFDEIPVISLCVEEGEKLLVKLSKNDPEIRKAMENPINSWGLISQVMAAVSSTLQERYLTGGEAALRKYMPGILIKIRPGMGANEVTAEIMTALMQAYPGRSDEGSSDRKAA